MSDVSHDVVEGVYVDLIDVQEWKWLGSEINGIFLSVLALFWIVSEGLDERLDGIFNRNWKWISPTLHNL